MKKVGEGLQLEQVLPGWSSLHRFMFQNPGEVVRDEYGVEACPERGVDVGTRTVPDHPGAGGVAAMMSGKRKVGFVVLLGKDFNCGEMGRKAGSLQFARLFGGIALGDEDKAVASGEIFQCFSDAGKKLDLVLCDAVSEAENALMLLVGGPAAGEVFEAVDQ